MRILIDTNILIPLEDSDTALSESLAEIHRSNHQLLIHPASREDIGRDTDIIRRDAMMSRISKYNEIQSPPSLEKTNEVNLFGEVKRPNDSVDNRILYALYKNCCHWLLTEDEGIHKKARKIGLADSVFTLEQLLAVIRKLDKQYSEVVPNIKDVLCHEINVNEPIFESLKESYDGFEQWYSEQCCKTGRHAWTCTDHGGIAAICIYKEEDEPIVTNDSRALDGKAIKLCTFKVEKKGYKLGELLLKQSFNYAYKNSVKYIYVTIDPDDHDLLRELFADFGFVYFGVDRKGRDEVFVKELMARGSQDELTPLEFCIKYYPATIYKNNNVHLVPIKPIYHDQLFPELVRQNDFFIDNTNSVGNTIKKAYLCHANIRTIQPGDLIFFYRTSDLKAITSYGVVERVEVSNDIDEILKWVAKRTVYTTGEISEMTKKDVLIVLFRIVRHLDENLSYEKLLHSKIISGPIQSITNLNSEKAVKLIEEAKIDDCAISN